jgi:aminoacyl tRNA synthase complex-interacting multifunctional protein 1
VAGQVLCTSNEDHTQVDLVSPPEGAPNGERITWAGVDGEPPEGVLNPKKKQFEKLAPGLQSNGEGVACFEGNPFLTSKGPCTTTMPGCHIK